MRFIFPRAQVGFSSYPEAGRQADTLVAAAGLDEKGLGKKDLKAVITARHGVSEMLIGQFKTHYSPTVGNK